MLLRTSKVPVKRMLWACSAALVFTLFHWSDSNEQRSSGVPAAAATPKESPISGTPLQFRLVTTEQYLNTIADVFGPDVKLPSNFAPMQRVEGLLQLGALNASVSENQLEIYQTAAQSVVTGAISPARRDFIFGCRPADLKKADETCAKDILRRFGALIFRRAMEPAELEQYAAVAVEAGNRLGDFYRGLGVAFESLLISPEALYVVETAEPDPKNPGHSRLTANSLASRLSYFLWNSAPDQTLLRAAEAGELATEAGRARAVDRMIASPRFEVGMRAFFDDMFALDDFSNLAKDALIYPNFTAFTAADAREQTLRTIVDHLITKKRDYRDLYTTRDTFMSPALAAIYEIPSPPTWVPYTFGPQSPRAGLLTQVGFLAEHSHPGRSSPTKRGKALRELVLCQKVPDPPPNVDFSALENPDPNARTQRDRVKQHLQNPVCAGCHRLTDPIGLSLENFDGSGKYREAERGAPIDASGSLEGKAFGDVAGLSVALRDHPALPSCLVKRLYTYATGDISPAESKPALESLDERFAASGYRLPGLVRAIVLSQAFYAVRDQAQVGEEK